MATRKELAALTPIPEGLDNTTRVQELWTRVFHLFNWVDEMGKDFGLEVARGNVDGISHVNKFGENRAVASGTREVVWSGSTAAYPYPGSADITHISQASDQSTMRGETIEVQGLDTNWDPVTQDVDLNATNTSTAVALTTALRRVFRAKVQANVVTTADIAIHNSGDTTDYAIIPAGDNQTMMAVYTVPRDKTAYITSYYGDYVKQVTPARNPDSVEFCVHTADRENGYEFQVKHRIGFPGGSPGFQHFFNPPLAVGEKTDIHLTATPNGDVAIVHGGFDLYLVDDGAP